MAGADERDAGADPLGLADSRADADAKRLGSYDAATIAPALLSTVAILTGLPLSSGFSFCSTEA